MLAIIGILGGIVSLFSNIPYIIDTIRRKTKPQRVTWGVFLLLNITFLLNQTAIGATNSLWLVVSFTVSTLIIFSLSLFYGVGGHSKRDIAIIAGSLFGVFLWLLLGEPLVSVIISLIVATLAVIPTIIKSYQNPESETAIKWLLGGVAALMTLIAVGKFDAIILFPLYSLITQLIIYGILIVRRKTKSPRLR